MPSAFEHGPALTVPASNTTAKAAVIWSAASNLGESTIILDSGGNGRIGIAGDLDTITITSGTVTVDGIVAATTLTGAGSGITALNADNIGSGTVPVARLGDGNESNSTFLRGDNTWVAAGGDFSNGGDAGALILGTNDANSLTLETNNTARMVIASGGEITKPTQPAFSACVGSNKDNVTGGGAWYVIAYDTDSGGNGAWFDTGGNYNTSTYTFTAPVAGVYFFAATVRLLQTDTYNANNVLTEFRTTTNGSSSMMNYRFYHGDYIADVNGVMGIHWSALINLPASGTCQAVVYVAGSSNNIDVDGDTGTGMSYFSGYLLH